MVGWIGGLDGLGNRMGWGWVSGSKEGQLAGGVWKV